MSDEQKISLDVKVWGDDSGVNVQAFHDGKPISPRFSASYETLADSDLYNPVGDARKLLNDLIQLASQYVSKGFKK